ncbi:hypothetical protein BDZ97DRAFT_1764234 [Flammula alnicola]|nr:hypothetical protein BDZ97DRAFT_1764234 [Flammula alnicola]
MAESGKGFKSRTLVLCFDGTSSEYDADTMRQNTNVVKFFSLLKKDADLDEQLCYYQAGVGTFFDPGVVSPIFEWGAKVLDEAFAWYLDVHVMDGYKFLMQNYCIGDKICLFGFSRGAYTARALGGLLYKVGLLPRDNEAQVPFAYRMYKRTDAAGLQLCAGFKQTYCQSVNIEFMGVWFVRGLRETVVSVGVITGRTLPFTNSNSSIKTFRHALSLDEHRVRFMPNNYHRPSPNESAAKYDSEHGSPVPSMASSSTSDEVAGKRKKKRWGFFGLGETVRIKKTGKAIAPELTEDGVPDDVLEVWFSGCHSAGLLDVGGGAVSNDTVNSLSNISLRWMIREVVASGCGIKFDPIALERANISLGAEPTTDQLDLDMTDALEPLHDELKLNRLWWILEVLPMQFSWQDAKGVWRRKWGIHLGRGREIVDPQPNFHVSVQKRIASPLKYTPKARWKAGTEIYLQ